jgi:hypothetical protein
MDLRIAAIGIAVFLSACANAPTDSNQDSKPMEVQSTSSTEPASPTPSVDSNDRVNCGQGWVLRVADRSLSDAKHTLRCYVQEDGQIYFELSTGEVTEDGMPVSVIAFLQNLNSEVVSFEASEVDSDLKPPMNACSVLAQRALVLDRLFEADKTLPIHIAPHLHLKRIAILAGRPLQNRARHPDRIVRTGGVKAQHMAR